MTDVLVEVREVIIRIIYFFPAVALVLHSVVVVSEMNTCSRSLESELPPLRRTSVRYEDDRLRSRALHTSRKRRRVDAMVGENRFQSS